MSWSSAASHLRLGYTDVENCGDNNYNDIDDIDAGPCKGKGYAFVRIEIAHGAASAPSRREPHFNEVFRLATHNSYWVKRDNVVEAFASGVQQRLVDQLIFEDARSIEIDVHKDTPILPWPQPPEPHNWTVYHTDKQSNSLCTPLRECLKHLRLFHHVPPQHEAVVVITASYRGASASANLLVKPCAPVCTPPAQLCTCSNDTSGCFTTSQQCFNFCTGQSQSFGCACSAAARWAGVGGALAWNRAARPPCRYLDPIARARSPAVVSKLCRSSGRLPDSIANSRRGSTRTSIASVQHTVALRCAPPSTAISPK